MTSGTLDLAYSLARSLNVLNIADRQRDDLLRVETCRRYRRWVTVDVSCSECNNSVTWPWLISLRGSEFLRCMSRAVTRRVLYRYVGQSLCRTCTTTVLHCLTLDVNSLILSWRIWYVSVTTLSGVYYASVTSIIHDAQCCNLLISWPLTRWR